MSKPVFDNLFRFSGRRNRQSYFLYQIAAFSSSFVAVLLGSLVMSPGSESGAATGSLLIIILFIPFMISAWAVASQRCRDFGWSGWSLLLGLIPFVGTIFSVALFFIPGDEGSNRYGPDPLDRASARLPMNHLPA